MKNWTWKFYSADETDAFQASWDDINKHGPHSPLLDYTFMEFALQEFGDGGELFAVCAGDEGPVAACILIKDKIGVWQTFQPSQCPLGAWVQRSDVGTADLLDLLVRSLPGVVLAVGVTQQDPDIVSPAVQGDRIRVRDYIETARVEIEGSFDEYWAKRGKNLRQNLNKQANRLLRNGIQMQFVEIQEPAAAGAAVDAYGLLESRGWKAATGTALHPSNSQGIFYKSLLQEYCRRGEGVIYQLWYGDDLVATDLCLKRDGVLIILKTTHDENQKTTSPALLMRKQAFERLFRSGERRIEFYGKVMDWHRKWTDDIRMLYHVTQYRSRWIAKMRDGD